MKKLLTITLFCLSLFATGQEEIKKEKTRAKNAIYFEFAGNGLFYSINYDRIFFGKGIVHLGGRVGISAVPHDDSKNGMLIYYLGELNLLIGKNNNFLELGMGYTIEPTRHFGSDSSAPLTRFGYRFQKNKKGGFVFRAAVLPIISENGDLFFWGGISIGGSF